VRQLASRARGHLEQRRPRFQTSREQRDELARRFFAAVQDGDLAGLEALLAHDVTLTGDGGGKAPALARPLHGRNRVARALLNWSRLAARIPGASMRQAEVNGTPGGLLLDGDDRLVGVWALDISGGEIIGMSSIVNPDKLQHAPTDRALARRLGGLVPVSSPCSRVACRDRGRTGRRRGCERGWSCKRGCC